MAKLPLSLAPSRPYRTKDTSQQPRGISFWAFLVSIFVYISIIYVFNLSPSTLITTPKFWFFISNTLIIIIAADSGAFSSSSKENPHDFCYEYLANSRARNSLTVEAVDQKSITPVQKVENLIEKKVVVLGTSESTPEGSGKAHYDKKVDEARKIPRSKSDRAISPKPKEEEENKIILRRSETEKLQPKSEENEYLSMSDEELNRRIEEFIQKFNRQIRASRDQ